MLDNIKKRIAEQTSDVISKTRFEDDDTAIVAEYAHAIQELEELTIEGEPGSRSIELLLDNEGLLEPDPVDDIEFEEIGFNLKTGTIDVLSDAAIQTEYATMKSKDDFYTESENLIQLDNEDVDAFDDRRARYTDNMWLKYRQHVLQEGSFGYKRVNAVEDSVPSMATINFGEYRGSAYNVRMPIQHQVDRNGNLTRHQLESIYLAESCGMCENLMDEVSKDLCERYHISESASVWDTIVPSVLVAPIDPIDKHSVIVGFKNDANLSGMDFYRFTNPVCEYDTSNTVLEHAAVERLDNDKVRELSKFCITKNAAIKESNKEHPHYHRFVQEAINIGGDGGSDGNNQDAAPTQSDNGAAPESNDQGFTSASGGNADGQTQEEPKTVEVGKNDVSDDIANAAQAATTDNDEPTENQDSNTDLPDMSDMPSLDDSGDGSDGIGSTNMDATSTGDDAPNTDVDAQLDELNKEGNEEGALDSDGTMDASQVDIDHMSLNDLINQGTEALKSMSIEQLKEFLANNDTQAVTEAFILTNANINDEVDVLLRKTLGVLNDNKMEINQLVSEFKKYGKKLNRVLTKASKSPKVYNNNEIDNIKKLNKCLADLMVTIKASTDKSSIQVIKRLMKAFTSQAAIVGKIVEKKKKELPQAQVKDTKKNVQEHSIYGLGEFDYIQEALFTTAKTARENVLIRSGRVSADMAKIVRAAENDKLSRGMVQKMYGGITKQITTNIEGGSSDDAIRTGYATTSDYHIDSPEMDHLTSLISLINKITRKAAKREKWSIAFSGSEFSTLNKLKEDVNEFAEDTEYLLADTTGTSEKLLKAIAKEAGVISDTCKKISEWPRSIT